MQHFASFRFVETRCRAFTQQIRGLSIRLVTIVGFTVVNKQTVDQQHPAQMSALEVGRTPVPLSKSAAHMRTGERASQDTAQRICNETPLQKEGEACLW